ncbi:MAG: hypothetical protein K2X11_02865 [Acetobacteraceae bacterium]|nr:hypothetical protein [Acetobacteraceae bacterium]
MHERPEGPELLAAARRLLLDRLLPALPAHLHYEARMIANAMAIAARSAEVPAAALRALAPDEALLCSAIRAGRFAPGKPRHEEARAALLALARARCAVSAPKALDRA